MDIDFLFSFCFAWFPFFSQEFYHENFRLIVHPRSQGPDFYPSLHEFAYNRPFAASYPRGTKLPCWRVRLYKGLDTYVLVPPPFSIKSKTCALGGESLKERDICYKIFFLERLREYQIFSGLQKVIQCNTCM